MKVSAPGEFQIKLYDKTYIKLFRPPKIILYTSRAQTMSYDAVISASTL